MHLDFWDYMTFLAMLATVAGFMTALVLLMGLPGKIAYNRKHADADAVNVMGWIGFVVVVPWVQAFIWAFKPTEVVDIRRGPKEEKEAIEEIMAQHYGVKAAKKLRDR